MGRGADAPRDREAILVGQVDVEHDDVGRAAFQQPVQFRAPRRAPHLESTTIEVFDEIVTKVGFVFDHNDPGHDAYAPIHIRMRLS